MNRHGQPATVQGTSLARCYSSRPQTGLIEGAGCFQSNSGQSIYPSVLKTSAWTRPLLLLLVLQLCGCANIELTSADGPPVLLRNTQKREYRTNIGTVQTVVFPEGTYLPQFKTKNGTYYRAPRLIALQTFTGDVAVEGGVFIPFPDVADKRNAIWLTTSSHVLTRFAEPIIYDFGN